MQGAEHANAAERFFWQRQCTRLHKIYPIQRLIRSLRPQPNLRRPCTVDIGFALDESHRIGHDYSPKYIKRNFPLIDDRITRVGCEKIILDHGWPLPVKSGCDFCPLAGRRKFRTFLNRSPARFRELIRIEQKDPKYPERTIFPRHPLATMIRSQNLDDFETDEEEQMCDSGHCMT